MVASVASLPTLKAIVHRSVRMHPGLNGTRCTMAQFLRTGLVGVDAHEHIRVRRTQPRDDEDDPLGLDCRIELRLIRDGRLTADVDDVGAFAHERGGKRQPVVEGGEATGIRERLGARVPDPHDERGSDLLDTAGNAERGSHARTLWAIERRGRLRSPDRRLAARIPWSERPGSGAEAGAAIVAESGSATLTPPALAWRLGVHATAVHRHLATWTPSSPPSSTSAWPSSSPRPWWTSPRRPLPPRARPGLHAACSRRRGRR